MTTLRFTVPILPRTALSPNGAQGGSWRAKASATKELREATRIAAESAFSGRSGLNRARVGVEYRITSQRRRDGSYRPRDLGNALAALKPLFDGIVDAGIVPDDSVRYMELGETRIVKVERYEDECLFVTVEELG